MNPITRTRLGGLIAVALTAAVMIGLIGACQGGPDVGAQADANARAGDDGTAASMAPPKPIDPDELTLPPVAEAERLRPLAGEAMERAGRSLEQILADVSPPDYLGSDAGAGGGHGDGAGADADDAGDGERATSAAASDVAEPPLEAQHAYVAGRAAWHTGETFEAIHHFEQAMRLAPGEPAILRVLGQTYAEAGNRVRAAMYLRQAVELDRRDAVSLFHLGRFALEQRRVDEAIHAFHHALELVDEDIRADLALRPLLHYYLAGALRSAGYAAAAIDQHQRYHDALPDRPLRSSPGMHELMVLQEQAALNWQVVGDLHHQLGEPGRALEAYRRAMAAAERLGLEPEVDLIGRLVYSHLRLGAVEPARELTIDHVRRTDADAAALGLVRYLTRQGAGGTALAAELRTLYEQQGRPAALALAIADLQPGESGRALLREHLASAPADTRVFEGLIHRLMPEAVPEAVGVTAEAMAAQPDEASARARILFDAAGGAGALLEAFAEVSSAEREQPMVRVLEGLALMAAGRANEAAEPLEAALTDDPGLDAARLALARLAIEQGEYGRADELLAPVADRAEPAIVRMRVRVLSRTGEPEAALALLRRHMQRDGRSVELILQEAELQLRADKPGDAERTLLDALNAHPEDERIYARLLELYNPSGHQMPLVEDSQVQYQRLVRRLLSTIPDSRLGRLVRVELMAARSEYADAERLLRRMLEDDPLDLEALEQLLRVYMRSNQSGRARRLMERKVEAHPRHHGLLVLALRFYRETDDPEAAREVGEHLLALEPTDLELVHLLSGLFIWAGQPEQSVEVIERALAAEVVRRPVELASLLARAMARAGRGEAAVDRLDELATRFPGHTADIRCEQALLLDSLGESERAEQVLIEAHQAYPDHPRVNNALGYTWADRDKNLEQAKAMIQVAVEAEPDSAAYLDSLGWAYYKLGDFEAARKWLERSREAGGGDHPVILDHLGDTFYRLGDGNGARRAWSQAIARVRRIESPEDHPELAGLEPRIRAKIQALEAGDGPEVATSPGADEAPADESERPNDP